MLKTGFPLMKNALKLLAESVLIPLGLTAVASAIDVTIQKSIFGLGRIKLIMSNEEMNGIMKIVKSLEESGLLRKGVSESIKNESKKQKRVFSCMLLATLGARLLENLLTGKSTIRKVKGRLEQAKIFNAASSFKNFEMQKYYQNEHKFNGVYSRND